MTVKIDLKKLRNRGTFEFEVRHCKQADSTVSPPLFPLHFLLCHLHAHVTCSNNDLTSCRSHRALYYDKVSEGRFATSVWNWLNFPISPFTFSHDTTENVDGQTGKSSKFQTLLVNLPSNSLSLETCMDPGWCPWCISPWLR